MKLPADATASPRIHPARKDLAALLGLLTVEWSKTELLMAILYTHLVGAPMRKGRRIEALTFEHIESFGSKCKLLTELASEAIRDKESRKRFTGAIEKLRRLSSRRNDYVHGRWYISASYPKDLLWTKRFGPRSSDQAERVTQDVLLHLVKEIMATRNQFQEFFDEDFAHMRQPPTRKKPS